MARKKTEEVTEEVVAKAAASYAVTVEKDGIKYTLTNPIMVSAFLNAGYVEV